MKLKAVILLLSAATVLGACGSTTSNDITPAPTETIAVDQVSDSDTVEEQVSDSSVVVEKVTETVEVNALDNTLEKMMTEENTVAMSSTFNTEEGSTLSKSSVYVRTGEIDTYNEFTVGLNGDATDIKSPIAYIAEVDGETVTATYGDEGWEEVEDDESYKWLLEILKHATLGPDTDVTEEFSFYSLEFSEGAFKCFDSSEKVTGVARVNKLSGLIESISLEATEILSNEGDKLTNLLSTITIKFEDNISNSPIGFEEVTGYVAKSLDPANAESAIESAKEYYNNAYQKTVTYTFQGVRDGVTDIHNIMQRNDKEHARLTIDWDSFSTIDEIGKNAGRSDSHLAKREGDDFNCVILGDETLEYRECDGGCSHEQMDSIFDSIEIGELKEINAQYAYYNGKIKTSDIPHLNGLVEDKELDCTVSLEAGNNTVTGMTLRLEDVTTLDGGHYDTIDVSVGFGYSSEPLEMHVKFEEALLSNG